MDDLFLVKRYDAATEAADPVSREEKLLRKLQKNIELKKKQKVRNVIEPVIATEIDEPAPVTPDTEHVEEAAPLKEEPTVQKSIEASNFLVLGEDKRKLREKVKRILPSWLEYPELISNDLNGETTPIADVKFISNVLKVNLGKMNVNHLFPVQASVIPWILEAHKKPAPFRPRDLCVSAPTGSGKTIAFALPIVETLKDRMVQKVRALVVLPVRELADQVFQVFTVLCRGTNLTCGLLSPKRTFEDEQKSLIKIVNGQLYSKVDIVVTTAGRLVEHLHSTKGFCLKSLKFLVIDEADRIMDQIQNDWLYHFDNHVRQESQTLLFGGNNGLFLNNLEQNPYVHKLLFSATLSSDPEKLENIKLFRPKLFTAIAVDFKYDAGTEEKQSGDMVGKFTTPAQLVEKTCETELRVKPLTLFGLIKENNWKRFLCFTNSNESAHRLAFVLRKLSDEELIIEELSSMLNKSARNTILTKFTSRKIHGLICSDTLARGIDIPDVDVVICYDSPRHIRTYVHRIGRTARAGKAGLAVTLLIEEDKPFFKKMLVAMGKTEDSLQKMVVPAEFEDRNAKKYANVLEELQKHLVKETKLKTVKKLREENSKVNNSSGNELNGILGMLQQQMQTQSAPTNTITKSIDKHEKRQNKKRKAGKGKDNTEEPAVKKQKD